MKADYLGTTLDTTFWPVFTNQTSDDEYIAPTVTLFASMDGKDHHQNLRSAFERWEFDVT